MTARFFRKTSIVHRGPTHTVWFALAVAGVLGLAGALIGSDIGLAATFRFGAFGILVGVLTVGAHLVADALTPKVHPFAPIRDVEYTLGVTTASNPVANYVLLALGSLAATIAAVLGSGASNAVSL